MRHKHKPTERDTDLGAQWLRNREPWQRCDRQPNEPTNVPPMRRA